MATSKVIKEIVTDVGGNTTIEYSDDTTQKYNVADVVTAQTNPLTRGISLLAGGVDVLAGMASNVTASRNAAISDSGNVLKCSSSSPIVISIQNDATSLWVNNETIGAYQAGTGAVSFLAGSGVTFRGSSPSAGQYSTQGIMRVGANEWAYL